MAVKDEWAKKNMERLGSTQETGRGDTLGGKLAGKWARQRWDERWKGYLDSVPASWRTRAHDGGLHTHGKLHHGLRKAESSLAVQLRTEKVGFATFLSRTSVGTSLIVGFQRQTNYLGSKLPAQ